MADAVSGAPRLRLRMVNLGCPDVGALLRVHLDPAGHPFCLYLA